jgi:hypothetical protein
LDLEWQWANLCADHGNPTLATRPLSRVVREALWNVCTLQERNDTLTFDDPAPGIFQVLEMLQRAYSWGSKLVHRLVREIPAETPTAAPREPAQAPLYMQRRQMPIQSMWG